MNQDIETRFTYHQPTKEKQNTYSDIRYKAKELAYLLDKVCPNSREKSLALTKLEEVVMWANASVSRNQEERK